MRTRLTILNCLLAGKLAGNFSKKSTLGETQALRSTSFQWFSHEFPTRKSREFFRRSRQFCERSREFRTSEQAIVGTEQRISAEAGPVCAGACLSIFFRFSGVEYI